jgi:hypothetical protein
VLVGGQASPRDSAPAQPDGPVEPLAAAVAVRVKARAPRTHIDKARQVIGEFFTRQGQMVLSRLGGKARHHVKADLDQVWDGQRWDNELAAVLYALAAQISRAAGRRVLEELGLDAAGYDQDRTLAWLHAHASGVATGINGITRQQLLAALAADDPLEAARGVFETAAGPRAAQIALTQITALWVRHHRSRTADRPGRDQDLDGHLAPPAPVARRARWPNRRPRRAVQQRGQVAG